MKSFDVVIVGAGPGGIKCAEILTKAKKSVLLLEKNKEVGSKVCAGGLTRKDVEYFNPPENILEFKYTEAWLNTPLQRIKGVASRPILFTIDRKQFGQWQLKSAGVTATTNSAVTEIGKDYIIVNSKEKIKFKFLVGADGSASIVRRHLGLKTEKYCLGLHYIVKNNKYNKIESYFDSKLFKNGYAWIFPHKGYASIGCGAMPSSLDANKLRTNFDKWIKKQNIDVSNAKLEAFPINFDYRGHKFNNIFLVGDAAGLASNATGEGIYQAAISGEEVAKQILNPDYDAPEIKKILETKKLQEKISLFILKSGFLRPLVYELLAFAFRFNFMLRIAKNVFA